MGLLALNLVFSKLTLYKLVNTIIVGINDKSGQIAGADPEFLLGGGANPWGGGPPKQYFSNIFWKTLRN